MDDNKEPIPDDDIISILNDMEDEMVRAKFYSTHSIILYGYINSDKLKYIYDKDSLVKTALKTHFIIYESPYIAEYIEGTPKNKTLMAFAISLRNNFYDELDISLKERIVKSGKSTEEIQYKTFVIRHLKCDKNKKPYITYEIKNPKAIENIFPV